MAEVEASPPTQKNGYNGIDLNTTSHGLLESRPTTT